MKRCPGCGQTKALDAFSTRSGRRAGQPQGWCKVCSRGANRRWYATPEGLEVQREANRRWYATEGREAKQRLRATPEGREAHREANRRRRALKLNAPGSHTAAEWTDRLAEYGGRCAYCWVEKATTQDHMTPLTRGGSNSIDNIIPACRSCNSSKGARNFLEFLADRPRRSRRAPALSGGLRS